MIGKINLKTELSKSRGFTLMELLIVIAILGILGVAFVPNILKAPAKARDAVRVKKVQDVHTAIEAYYAEKGKLPESDVAGCVTDVFVRKLGMAAAPVDPNKSGSCSADVANKAWYLYKVVGANYVVGAITEVHENANTKMLPDAITYPVTSAVSDPAGTYFTATGPI